MDSISEKSMYDKVADNIRDNIEHMNRLLENCAINSKVVTQESQIAEFISLDVDNLIKNQPKCDYYDLEQVANVFNMLGSSKSENKKRNKMLWSSLSSLTSSSLSLEDAAASSDYNKEVKYLLNEIRNTLESISNSSINAPDLNSISNKETAKSNSFVDLFTKLQKLSKELQNIASTDTAEGEDDLNIDVTFIERLKRLSEVSANLLSLQAF